VRDVLYFLGKRKTIAHVKQLKKNEATQMENGDMTG
jgi:hypothetical protein